MSRADVLIVGAAYKPDVSDTRESPAINIIAELSEWDAGVDYHDPHVPELDVGEETYESVSLTRDRLQTTDCVIIVTNHLQIDTDAIVNEAPLVFDTRDATGHPEASNVVRL